MNTILNLTQHPAAPEQVAAGVVEPTDKAEVSQLLTFEELPKAPEMWNRAERLAAIAVGSGATAAMVGGAPFFTAVLEQSLIAEGIVPLFAFSRRVSVETIREDGTVEKKSVFQHEGFVPSRAIAVKRGELWSIMDGHLWVAGKVILC